MSELAKVTILTGSLFTLAILCAWPVNRDGSGIPSQGGNGAPCCRSRLQNAILGFPEVTQAKDLKYQK